MEKVKVNKDIFDALNFWKLESQKPLEIGLKQKIKYGHFFTDRFKNLNDLTVEQFVQCMVIGYELEETPEEKLVKQYNYPSSSEYAKGFDAGIKFTLKTLGIKIKGINE